jgi:nucleoside-diphosphate-sugar epimerase
LNWSKKKVIVTGGAGFIGSKTAEMLLERGAEVTIVDKLQLASKSWLWEAKLRRLNNIFGKHGIKEIPLQILDLLTERDRFKLLAEKHDIVFHLSAVFGGREFVDIHQAETAKILGIDHNAISASYEAGIDRLHYSSSACVYAPSLNKHDYLLKEDDILSTGEGWQSSDNLYGFAKLMGEMQLAAYHREHGFKSSACRYLTVYGEGEFSDSHAIAALTERALDKENPYVVWGSGNQERGFTYVDDIVNGSIIATEKVIDANPINLGWDERYKIRDVANMILKVTDHKPEKITFDTSKPEGPFSRALDITKAKHLLGWEPKVHLEEGLRRTAEWHRSLRAERIPIKGK